MTIDRKMQLLIWATVLGSLPSLANSACNLDINADAPSSRYTVSGDLVSDNYTGLMWKKCSEGLSGSSCSAGVALSVTWQNALGHVATVNTTGSLGHSDWRLPSRNEMGSLVERQCVNPAINSAIFPGTPSQSFWTSSPYALNGSLAWYVGFDVGDVGPLLKSGLRNVRLVRGGF